MLEVDYQKLLIALAKAGMTASDLNEKSGVGRNTISRIINHEGSVRPAIVGKLAKVLNIAVEDLL
ncbi:MAG TPA: helix-turn-helix transcriptional regulator [Clostridiaceae bacterium]